MNFGWSSHSIHNNVRAEQDVGATGTRSQSSSSNCSNSPRHYCTGNNCYRWQTEYTDFFIQNILLIFDIPLNNTELKALLQQTMGLKFWLGCQNLTDDIFGQAGVSVSGTIFARFKSDGAFRHWETTRPGGLVLCPSHPTGQELRNSCGFTTAKVAVPSESWSSALVIKICTPR